MNLVNVTASFTISNTAALGDWVVNFDASASTGSVLTYAWDFGDGTTSVGQPVPTTTHTYPNGTTRNTTLTVTDVSGSTASVTLSVTPN